MIKPLFPLLLSYVFMTSQVFAISGGPVFTNGAVTVTGTYSGVLQGVTETNGTSTGPAIPGDPLPPPSETGDNEGSNAIGLYDITVPSTGLATGAFMLFADGTIFGGTINAAADPDAGTLKGLLEGTFSFNLNFGNAAGTVSTVAITATAVGRIDAEIRANTSAFATSLARLTGSASLAVNFGDVNPTTLEPVVLKTITFDVTGFKQANLTS